MRQAEIVRKTSETDISLKLNIDGVGKSNIKTGCGFLDHMLTLFASHGRFDLDVTCVGDTYVDYHHSAEDIAIALGQAFSEALGDKRGIYRYADAVIPMDEALIAAAVDISGRSCLVFNVEIPAQKVGDFDTELVEEFFASFVRNSNITLHIRSLDGSNSHHIIEGAFKCFARVLRAAVKIDADFADSVPSTKGVL